jgi:hypothetical protein
VGKYMVLDKGPFAGPWIRALLHSPGQGPCIGLVFDTNLQAANFYQFSSGNCLLVCDFGDALHTFILAPLCSCRFKSSNTTCRHGGRRRMAGLERSR